METLKLGCDVSKADVHICLYDPAQDKILGSRKFSNSNKGFEEIRLWCEKKARGAEYDVIMEATGVYHENLVSFFFDRANTCYVVVPRVIKHFAKGQNVRLKNDKADARLIAVFGANIGHGVGQAKVKPWRPFTKNYHELRAYSRQILTLIHDRSILKNRLHALEFVNQTPADLKTKLSALIEEYDTIIAEYTSHMEALAKSDSELSRRLDKVATIKGISKINILHIICETNGFQLFKNSRQLVAYAGLDIPDRQSGRCRKPGHISKCGNAWIRQVLYMPAIVCGNHGGQAEREFYQRLKIKFGKNHGNQAVIAMARKLLALIFSLWVNEAEYDENHVWAPPTTKSTSGNQETGLLLSIPSKQQL